MEHSALDANHILTLGGFSIIVVGVLFAMIKWFAGRFVKENDEKFTSITKHNDDSNRRVEDKLTLVVTQMEKAVDRMTKLDVEHGKVEVRISRLEADFVSLREGHHDLRNELNTLSLKKRR